MTFITALLPAHHGAGAPKDTQVPLLPPGAARSTACRMPNGWTVTREVGTIMTCVGDTLEKAAKHAVISTEERIVIEFPVFDKEAHSLGLHIYKVVVTDGYYDTLVKKVALAKAVQKFYKSVDNPRHAKMIYDETVAGNAEVIAEPCEADGQLFATIAHLAPKEGRLKKSYNGKKAVFYKNFHAEADNLKDRCDMARNGISCKEGSETKYYIIGYQLSPVRRYDIGLFDDKDCCGRKIKSHHYINDSCEAKDGGTRLERVRAIADEIKLISEAQRASAAKPSAPTMTSEAL